MDEDQIAEKREGRSRRIGWGVDPADPEPGRYEGKGDEDRMVVRKVGRGGRVRKWIDRRKVEGDRIAERKGGGGRI